VPGPFSATPSRHPGRCHDKRTHGEFSTDAIGTGLRYGLGHWPTTEATLFIPEDVTAFCAPALLQRGPPLRGPADLARHWLLQRSTRPGAWATFCIPCDASQADLGLSPTFEHFFMLIEATAAGTRLALLPEFLAADAMAAGRLVRPFDRVVRNEEAYYIMHAPGTGASR